jgi:hypothetical protein
LRSRPPLHLISTHDKYAITHLLFFLGDFGRRTKFFRALEDYDELCDYVIPPIVQGIHYIMVFRNGHHEGSERSPFLRSQGDVGLQRVNAFPNRSPRKRNRSLGTCTRKFRILKIHRAETRPENLGLPHELPDIPRQRPGSWPLTARNVDTSLSAGNSWGETPLAGWGARIRTWEWRNQNLPDHIDF